MVAASGLGAIDATLSYFSRFSIPNITDWSFSSSYYVGSDHSAGKSVFATAYTGSLTIIGGADENSRFQRPALQCFRHYDTCYNARFCAKERQKL